MNGGWALSALLAACFAADPAPALKDCVDAWSQELADLPGLTEQTWSQKCRAGLTADEIVQEALRQPGAPAPPEEVQAAIGPLAPATAKVGTLVSKVKRLVSKSPAALYGETPARPDAPPPTPAEAPAARVLPSRELARLLSERRYGVDPATGDFVHKETGKRLSADLYASLNVVLNGTGELRFIKPVPGARGMEVKVGGPMLDRLLASMEMVDRLRAADLDEAGKRLQGWLGAVAYDGKQLVEPATGKATLPGLLLYQALMRQGGLDSGARRPSAESLLKAFRGLNGAAMGPGFAADVLTAEKELALTEAPPPTGREPAHLPELLKDFRSRLAARVLEAGDEESRTRLGKLVGALDALRAFSYEPPSRLLGPAPERAGPRSEPPDHALLPALLKELGPLSREEERVLVTSFPLGEVVSHVEAPRLWEQGMTGKNVTVAVIDSGTHGESVSRVIAAIAPDARVSRHEVSGKAGNWNEVTAAIHKAYRDGSRIINLSLGETRADQPTDRSRLELERTINELSSKGVLFLIAAGNDGRGSPHEWPARVGAAVSVGAATPAGRLSPITSTGRFIDGAGELRHKDIFVTLGENVRVKAAYEGSRSESGTSFAAPAVAGLAALVRQRFSYLPTSVLGPLTKDIFRHWGSPAPAERFVPGNIIAVRVPPDFEAE